MLTQQFTISNAPVVQINYKAEEQVLLNNKPVTKTVYKTISLAEFAAMKPEDRPESFQIVVQNISLTDFESGKVSIEVPDALKDYSLTCRVVRPKQGDTWQPFVAGQLVKRSILTKKEEEILSKLF